MMSDLQAGLLGAGALGHILHYRAGGDAITLNALVNHVNLDAQIGLAGNIAVLDEVRDNFLHVVDREREAQPLGGHTGGGLCILGRHDTYHVAIAVEQRPPELPGLMAQLV